MNRTVKPVKALEGTIRVPADKSIGHRAAIFAAISSGTSRIANYPRGADTLSTVRCLGQLGVESSWEGDALIVHGRGLNGLRRPSEPLDCGNSGTTMRLLTGLLAAQDFDSVLVGDESLMRRPMERVAGPLRSMGASITLDDGRAPIRIHGRGPLSPINHTLSVASAQVKTAVILAALTADGESTIREPSPSRDHTERMLELEVGSVGGLRVIHVSPKDAPEGRDLIVPGDFSSAAFFIAGASIVADADILLAGVGINTTRTGLRDVLVEAGADIEFVDVRGTREPFADIRIGSSRLRPLSISAAIVPALVDEVPVLAVVASQIEGTSRFTGIGELRAKESDRIATTTESLGRLGADVTAGADSMTIHGQTPLTGTRIDSSGDHRIAMAMAIAGLVAEGETTIIGAESASVSYPGFWEDLEAVSVR